MSKFRKKPVVVEAMQHTGSLDILAWAGTDDAYMAREGGLLYINTLEGTMTANVGNWVIKGVNGEIYPCRADIFEKTYEAVD